MPGEWDVGAPGPHQPWFDPVQGLPAPGLPAEGGGATAPAPRPGRWGCRGEDFEHCMGCSPRQRLHLSFLMCCQCLHRCLGAGLPAGCPSASPSIAIRDPLPVSITRCPLSVLCPCPTLAPSSKHSVLVWPSMQKLGQAGSRWKQGWLPADRELHQCSVSTRSWRFICSSRRKCTEYSMAEA